MKIRGYTGVFPLFFFLRAHIMLTKVMVQVIINAAPPATEMTIIIAVKIRNNVTLDKDNISYLKEFEKKMNLILALKRNINFYYVYHHCQYFS